MTTYSGFTVIEWQPDWKSGVRTMSKAKTRLDNRVTNFQDDGTGWPSPVGARQFRYVLDGRPVITAARAQFETFAGQLTPFWLPTWMYDLELVQGQASGDSTILIKYCGYARFYAISDYGRRHLAFILPGPSFIYRRVTGAVDNGDGTETLTLHTTFGVALPSTAMVSFLTLGRLASDQIDMHWLNFSLAVIEFPFFELPREAPTS